MASSLTRRSLFGATGGLAAGLLAPPGRAASGATVEERLHADWAFLARYHDDNARLVAEGRRVDCVLIGDSITEGWCRMRPDFFPPDRIGRGIGGQTTPQILVRFREDVVALDPVSVHIMAGTNDIAGNTGPMTPGMTQANIMSMTEVAQANGLRVILASIPPAARFPWLPEIETAQAIIAVNHWLRGYADRIGAVYADYHHALADPEGGMRPGLASDEVHPTDAGYSVMEPVALAAIRQAATLPKCRLRPA